jgi:hypothetical protein
MALNIWRRFGDLIKPAPEEVATVTLVYGDGTVAARALGGGLMRVRCAVEGVAMGDQVFVAGGEVRGKAPALRAVELEI